MLDLAIRHMPELQAKYAPTLFQKRYRYYHRTPGSEYFIPIVENNWDNIQFVSLDNGEVIGYLGAKINRLTQTAYDLETIKFTPVYSRVFSQDMGEFNMMLFNRLGMNRLVWSVVAGNPAAEFFDDLTRVCGVRIVGIFKNDVMLSDGRLYDLKYYEVLKEDFFRAIHENGASIFNYRDMERKG